MQTSVPTFLLSIPEIQMLSVSRCKDSPGCDESCKQCEFIKSVEQEACLFLPFEPFMTYPPTLFSKFFTFHNKDTPISIISVLSGYICVLRYASAVKDAPEHAAAKRRANDLEVANSERAKQWGEEASRSAFATCAMFERRVLYTMAIFHVVSKGLPDWEVEPVFQQACSKMLSEDIRIAERYDEKEAKAYEKLHRFVHYLVDKHVIQ